ncbi:S-adenosyl-L-methionine:benzoic acid/salicylic acid carboxyl methyltransferase 3-like [Rutidosis leptorrhynchoides]|uniref:S-adenosyl-L-methionine:benzoic acid/salicylic acid carboxyl methyltransferase 3-like n=1 Tax=Rutidosis leptorrhynchoides TaxID=125765 RepID=UPI003A99F40F
MVINAVAKTSLELGRKSPEVQINFNDLPTNDFNTIFSMLHEFPENSTAEQIKEVNHLPPCYFSGVPGSFFNRLFPSKSLNFVHSSYGLQWLSQLPELEEINKGNIYLSSTTPESVMPRGRMVLTLAGRTTEDARGEESYYLWRPLAMALQEMVLEGLVDEEKLDTFNLPLYTASPTEIMNLVEIEGSFKIDHLEIFDVNWEAWKTKKPEYDVLKRKETEDQSVGDAVVKSIRAGVESLVANHFGEGIIDDVFMRYARNFTDRYPKMENEVLVSITVSLIKNE